MYFVTSHSCFYLLHCVYNPLSTSMSYFPYNDCLHDNTNRFIYHYSFLSYFCKLTLSIWFRHLIYMNYPSTTSSLISLFIHLIHRVRTVASYRPSALTPPTPPPTPLHSAPLHSRRWNTNAFSRRRANSRNSASPEPTVRRRKILARNSRIFWIKTTPATWWRT